MPTEYYSDKLRTTILFAICSTIIVVALIVGIFTTINIHDGNATQRDRIAACVKTNDVVGCLNAVK